MIARKITQQKKTERLTSRETARFCEILDRAAIAGSENMVLIPIMTEIEGRQKCLETDRASQQRNSDKFVQLLTELAENIRATPDGDFSYDEIVALHMGVGMEGVQEAEPIQGFQAFAMAGVMAGVSSEGRLEADSLISQNVVQHIGLIYKAVLASRIDRGLDKFVGETFLTMMRTDNLLGRYSSTETTRSLTGAHYLAYQSFDRHGSPEQKKSRMPVAYSDLLMLKLAAIMEQPEEKREIIKQMLWTAINGATVAQTGKDLEVVYRNLGKEDLKKPIDIPEFVDSVSRRLNNLLIGKQMAADSEAIKLDENLKMIDLRNFLGVRDIEIP